jgi:thiamine pyrophosphokinase
MNTIILANGAFPQSAKLLRLLDSAVQIICCDGAVNTLVESGREPSVIIGDLDSVKPEVRMLYRDRLVQVADQDTNDLTKAVDWCVENGVKDVTILGATGKREDHAIGNISLLAGYSKKLNVSMLTDYGKFIAITETTTFDTFKGQQVSIFSLDAGLMVSSTGLKYPLKEYKLTSWWMGTLNEAVGNTFTLSINKTGNVIVYLLDER